MQILTSVDAGIRSTEEVFKALEKVFTPETSHALAHFKSRHMKNKASQSYNSYISQLRLALPECKY